MKEDLEALDINKYKKNVRTEWRYFVVIIETINGEIVMENELFSITNKDAEKEAQNILLIYYNSTSHCKFDYHDLVAKVEKRLVLVTE